LEKGENYFKISDGNLVQVVIDMAIYAAAV
jgi:hypothetical protein